MKPCPLHTGPTRECDECNGAGFVQERHERLYAALKACDYEQRLMVADALRAVCDDLLRADLHSPSSWLILGLLDGQGPVKEATKIKAASRPAKRKAA